MKKQLGQWFVETEEKLRSWVSANVVILGAPTADIMKGEPELEILQSPSQNV